MSSTRKRGLGKSLSQMFGEENIRTDFLKRNEESEKKEKEELVEKKEEKKPVAPQATIKKSEVKETQSKEEGSAIMVNINLVQPNVNQPRKNFNDEKLKELSGSIEKYGVLQPILVRKEGVLYKIIAGERRWRAAKIAGLTMVPVNIKEFDDRTGKEVALIENIQRENLNAVEEALAYQSLISEYGLTQEEVAKRVNKNRSTIANSLRILKLNKDVIEYIKDGKLSEGHARALLAIEDESLREKMAKRAIEEGLTVRDIEKLVRLEKMSSARKEKTAQNNTDELKQLRIFIKDIERVIKQKLGTKIKIVPKNESAGKIEIEYYSKEDLDRIYLMLNSIK